MSSEQQVTTSAEESYMATPESTPPLDLDLERERFDRAVAPLAQVAEHGERAADVAQRVEHRKRTLEANEIAAREVAAEQAPPPKPLDAGLLGDILRRPPEPPFRVDGLIPSDAGTLLVAQRKTGKTTWALNLARSLITGEDFLGRFDVLPITGRVAFLNFEVSGATFATWAHEAGIPPDRLFVVNLRGRRNPFTHPDDRATLAGLLKAQDIESVFIDPFGRAYDGITQNDAGEVGGWLSRLDEFARAEVGARDLILAAHAGWNGDRTRGSSALEDWADSVVTLTASQEEHDPTRYMRAIGRDVELDEDQLSYEHSTRRLALTGTGSRKAVRTDRKLGELAVFVVRAARQEPGASLARVQVLVKGMDGAPPFRSGEISKAAEHAARRGELSITRGGPGKGNSYRALSPNPSQPIPSAPGERPRTPPTPPTEWEG